MPNGKQGLTRLPTAATGQTGSQSLSGAAEEYRNPALTVDGIVIIDGDIVLVKRARDPNKGRFSLPGGFVEYGETVEHAVVRELEEETGLRTEILDIVGVYSSPGRDPRGHVVSVCFHLRSLGGRLKGGDDATSAQLHDLEALPDLAFDHADMVRDWMETRTFQGD